MKKEEDQNININNAPSKISLHIGEVQGEVDFLAIKGVTWHINPQSEYDLRYVHESLYEQAYNKSEMFKNAYASSKAALRDQKHLNGILQKYLTRMIKLASLQELLRDDKKFMDDMEDDLKNIMEQIKDYE